MWENLSESLEGGARRLRRSVSEITFDGTLICDMSFETLPSADLLTKPDWATSTAKATISGRLHHYGGSSPTGEL
jgi:hypothetical protein